MLILTVIVIIVRILYTIFITFLAHYKLLKTCSVTVQSCFNIRSGKSRPLEALKMVSVITNNTELFIDSIKNQLALYLKSMKEFSGANCKKNYRRRCAWNLYLAGRNWKQKSEEKLVSYFLLHTSYRTRRYPGYS